MESPCSAALDEQPRPDDGGASHLATLGGSAVSFTKAELARIFSLLLRLKAGKRGGAIVNPYVSIHQQMRELKGASDRIGCHAGRDIFFLGPDQASLRPCYHFSERVVDKLDGKALSADDRYLGCRDCRDQCFRDPSVVYAAATRPWEVVRQAIDDPALLRFALKDIGNLIANKGYRNG